LLEGFVRSEVGRRDFVLSCVTAEFDTNSVDDTEPWFVSAEFIVARALLETGISNLHERARGPVTFGPLALTREEWTAFIAESKDSDDFPATGWDSPISQIWAAAYRMRRDAKAFSGLTPTGEQPKLPTYLDLFHAYLCGSPRFARAMADSRTDAANAAKPVADLLTAELGAAKVAELQASRPQIYGGATTRADSDRAAKELLDRLLDEANREAAAAEPLTENKPVTAAGGGPAAKPPDGGPLGRLISRGEGDYKSFNRGQAGDAKGEKIDFSVMTIGEIMARQAAKTKPEKIFAVGKYQVIPTTLHEAVKKLGLPLSERFTDEMQEFVFRNYLVKGKRPPIFKFITGAGSSLFDATMALAQEFASVGRPDTGVSFHAAKGGNKASISPAEAGAALKQEREAYEAAGAGGMPPATAWSSLSGGLGAPAASAVAPVAASGNSGLDVDKAVSHLIAHASQHSTGLCARAVRLGLQAGGITISPSPAFAKAYKNILGRKHNFAEISRVNYDPKKGDIAVIENHPGGHPAGHICMYTGSLWVSDFKQREMYPGPGYRTHKPPFRLFRP
jgi:hypothetical protein